MSIVSTIAKVSQSISTISTIEKVGVSFSLGLGLRLSKGNSGQKGLKFKRYIRYLAGMSTHFLYDFFALAYFLLLKFQISIANFS